MKVVVAAAAVEAAVVGEVAVVEFAAVEFAVAEFVGESVAGLAEVEELAAAPVESELVAPVVVVVVGERDS